MLLGKYGNTHLSAPQPNRLGSRGAHLNNFIQQHLATSIRPTAPYVTPHVSPYRPPPGVPMDVQMSPPYSVISSQNSTPQSARQMDVWSPSGYATPRKLNFANSEPADVVNYKNYYKPGPYVTSPISPQELSNARRYLKSLPTVPSTPSGPSELALVRSSLRPTPARVPPSFVQLGNSPFDLELASAVGSRKRRLEAGTPHDEQSRSGDYVGSGLYTGRGKYSSKSLKSKWRRSW